MTVKKPLSQEQLINKYFDELKKVTLEDKKTDLNKAIQNQIARYNLSPNLNITSIPNLEGTEDYYKSVLTNYVQVHNLSKFATTYVTGDEIQYLRQISDALSSGYSVPTKEESNQVRYLVKLSGGKSFVLVRPEADQEADKKNIREALTSAMTSLVDIENKKLMEHETVMQWVEVESERQQQEYMKSIAAEQQAMIEKAIKTAQLKIKTKEA